jgi:hypothetical protein
VNENGDESGSRVVIASLVHRSRRTLSSAEKGEKTGENVEIWLNPYRKENCRRKSAVSTDSTV